MTDPLADNTWSESRLVAVSNGAAYECLRSYLIYTAKSRYAVYQPVSINAYMVSSDDHVGEKVVPFLDSYRFTLDLLQELVSPLEFWLDVNVVVVCCVTLVLTIVFEV